jgi:predicted  nucleic acid-binding Zn-ribbon protein
MIAAKTPTGEVDKAVAALFFICTAVGTALIVTVTLMGADWWVHVTLSAAVMVVYVLSAMGRYRRGCQLSRDQIGDSFYYLGFLLTLAAMAVSMVVLGLGKSGNTSEILGRFGVALTTTGIGMLARLLFVQFFLGEEQAERAAHHSVQQSLSDLQKSVKDVAGGIRDAGKSLTDELKDSKRSWVDKASKAATESLARAQSREERLAKATEKLLEQVANRQEQLFATLERRIAGLAVEPEKLRDSLQSAMQGLDKEVADLGQSMRRMRTVTDGQTAQFDGFADGVQAARQGLSAFEGVIRDMGSQAPPLADLARAMAGITQALAPMRAELTATTGKFADYNGSLSTAKTAFEEELRRIVELRKGIEAELTRATEATSAVYRNLSECAGCVVRELGTGRGA